jgi:hypothetical protein
MNTQELNKKLDDAKINPQYYSLNGFEGGIYNDRIILEKEGAHWLVYYTERGNKYDIHVFNTEDEACLFLFNWINRDPSIKLK